MPAIFFILDFLIKNWCTFPMSLEALAISLLESVGGSFLGAALFWLCFCPNHRCCQMRAIRKTIEKVQE